MKRLQRCTEFAPRGAAGRADGQGASFCRPARAESGAAIDAAFAAGPRHCADLRSRGVADPAVSDAQIPHPTHCEGDQKAQRHRQDALGSFRVCWVATRATDRAGRRPQSPFSLLLNLWRPHATPSEGCPTTLPRLRALTHHQCRSAAWIGAGATTVSQAPATANMSDRTASDRFAATCWVCMDTHSRRTPTARAGS